MSNTPAASVLTCNFKFFGGTFPFERTAPKFETTSELNIIDRLGDIGPTGKLVPKSGVVLSHIFAKALLKSLERIIKQREERMGEIVDPSEGAVEISTEPAESDLKQGEPS